MTLDVYPVYEVSPDSTGYVPVTTPVTPPSSEVLLLPPAPESLPPGAPVSLNGVVACDITLLNRSADLSLLAIPLLPLPDGMLLVPVMASDQPSTSTVRPSRREQRACVASPSRNLSREGPFDAYCAPSHTGDHPLVFYELPGCPYRMTSYTTTDVTVVDPVHRIQLHHPGSLSSLGLLSRLVC